jgi:acyl-coenzyme A thioesterase PaaI-like protein
MTTVDQTTHFIRAVTSSDVLADARVVRLGPTTSFGRVTDNKPAAMGIERLCDAGRTVRTVRQVIVNET